MSEYISTRDIEGRPPRQFYDVVEKGLEQDGGLSVPVRYPRISIDDLRAMADHQKEQGYLKLFVDVRSRLVGDSVSLDKQFQMAKAAFTPEKFPDAVNGNYAPVRQFDEKLFIQNLSLGPTAVFKDLAMQPFAQDLDYVLADRIKAFLGASSGDTFSAASESVGALPNTDMFLVVPSPKHGNMSPVQWAQGAKNASATVHNITMDMPFGPLQDIVKNIQKDPEFVDLGAVNSINWARVASQIPYYFSGYFQAIEQSGSGAKIGDEVDFVVPSGNMGNVVAGYVAKMMGLPIRNIIVATNENEVLHDLIQHGVYRRKKTALTNSPSMDIDAASNSERPLFDLFERDPVKIRQFMETFSRTGSVSLADVGMGHLSLRSLGFDSGVSNNLQRVQTIRTAYEVYNDIIDPHTAAALHVTLERPKPEIPTIIMETASQVKFEDTTAEAIGRENVPERQERFRNIERYLQNEFAYVALRDEEELKDFIRAHRR